MSKMNFYVCEMYGCVWVDAITNMRDDYAYGVLGKTLWFFETEERAQDFAYMLMN